MSSIPIHPQPRLLNALVSAFIRQLIAPITIRTGPPLISYGKGEMLTAQVIAAGATLRHSLRVSVVSAGCFAHGFVARGHENDGEE